MIPMSPWGQDHLFDSASGLSRLAYGLWGFQEPSCSAAFLAGDCSPPSRQPLLEILAFPADCPHRTDCHCLKMRRVPPDTRVFQHIANCTQCVTALRGSALARQGIPP
jgi:hypothetical protein